MSFTPPYTYITARELAELVKKTETKEVQVIDVRDDDFVGESRDPCSRFKGAVLINTLAIMNFVGGNIGAESGQAPARQRGNEIEAMCIFFAIVGAHNSPSSSIYDDASKLVEKYKDGRSN